MTEKGDKRISVLVVLNRIPWPLHDGGAICTHETLLGYSACGYEVDGLMMNTSKNDTIALKWKPDFPGAGCFDIVNVDNRIWLNKALKVICQGRSYVLERFRNETFRQQLILMLKERQYDIVHLDALSTCLYLKEVRQHSTAAVVYRAHNVESALWFSKAGFQSNWLLQRYFFWESERIKQIEQRVLGEADMVLAISPSDQEQLLALAPQANITCLPVSVAPTSKVEAFNGNFQLCFIGSLDWAPNVEGLHWFISTVWPAIRKHFPQMQLHIAGKKMPKAFMMAGDGIISYGEVDNAMSFIQSFPIFIAPQRFGSGVRIKILEALSAGKIVLATAVAAEGLLVEDGRDILLANTAEDFVRQLKRIYQDPAFALSLIEQAQGYVGSYHSRDHVIEKLKDSCQKAISFRHDLTNLA